MFAKWEALLAKLEYFDDLEGVMTAKGINHITINRSGVTVAERLNLKKNRSVCVEFTRFDHIVFAIYFAELLNGDRVFIS